MYIALTLAKSNTYYGAWALSTDSSELSVAAATARVSSTEAFKLCAQEIFKLMAVTVLHGNMTVICFIGEQKCCL